MYSNILIYSYKSEILYSYAQDLAVLPLGRTTLEAQTTHAPELTK